MKNQLLSLLCFGAFAISWGQGTQLLREPTISQTHIVFIHADDLWVTAKDGGTARRLTSAIGTESFPHLSPDGKMVAFTGQYDGNTDVYVVPVEGGEPKRLTWHPGGDFVQGWMPDGQHVLFRSGRESKPTAEGKFYQIPVSGGMPQALPIPRAYAGEVSADGNYAAYQMIGFWDPEWRNYRGGQAKPIWVVNLNDYSMVKTPQPDNERHTNPVWMNGTVYFLSERDYANNIWSFDPKNEKLEQLTFHKDFDVKSLDAGGGLIVYEQGGYLHTINPETKDHQQLVIEVNGDLNWSRPRWEKVSPTMLTNASLSPTGKRALFEYRGEIFTVPKEKGNWRNLTQTSGVADRDPIWSPDGQQIAWFADQGGEYQLMVGDQFGMETPKPYSIPDPTFFFQPAWSPDGTMIAFMDTDYQLRYLQLSTGGITLVDQEDYAHPQRIMYPVWSPDSRWMAYAKLGPNQFRTIWVFDTESKTSTQLTDGMSHAISPVWDQSGKYMYFLASTDFGLSTGWLDMSSYDMSTNFSVYLMILNDGVSSPFLPKSDEEEKKDVEDHEAEKDSKDVEVIISFEDIDSRTLALDIPSRNYQGLVPGPENTIFYLEDVPNQTGNTLHKFDIEEAESSVFMSGVNQATTSQDRKNLLVRTGASWSIVPTSGKKQSTDDAKLKLSELQVKIDPKEEWKQIYREGWRYMRDFLYVDNVHGAPWNEVYEWYKPWVDHVRHRTDMNYIIDIISGEVAVGHSYVSGGDFPDVDRVPVGLLGADYEMVDNKYQIRKIYKRQSWNPGLTAPLDIPGIDINEGDYILSVDGNEVTTEKNLYAYFEGTAGRQVQITVNRQPTTTGARSFTVVPISSESGLRRMDWVEGNRKKVDELSGGKLAYVYVPNTGNTGYRYFNRYYFAQQNKKGAVIDERNNGGGSAADYMVDVMARELHGYFNSRTKSHRPFTTPMAALWGPKVMIINERAGSGGDLLPYLFRKMEIGPLIGTQTWGGLVGTWDTPRFVDNGRMVAPRGGFFDVNGEWAVEGVGIAPDIEVIQSPSDVINGRDPQLERAVEEALRLLESEGVELKSEPEPPVRWKRPGN